MAEPLTGIGVSEGRVAAPLLRMGRRPELPEPVPVTDPVAEAARARRALDAVAAGLAERARRSGDQVAAAILEAASMMAADPVLAEEISERIGAGLPAAHAIDAVLGAHRTAVAAAGGRIAERATDIDDIRVRAIAAALGLPVPAPPDPGYPYILVAEDLAPADTAGIDTRVVLGLVTERGGPTSHTAILARALGIPAIVRCAGAMALPDGTPVLIDGGTGVVRPDPPAGLLTGPEPETRSDPGGPGRTSDGHPVKLLINIGGAADLAVPAAAGAEGVGLLRTEFLFLGRAEAPSADEQARTYGDIFRKMDGRTIVVRTLDAGADKPLPFLRLPAAPNPALGVRGLRIARVAPEVLATQLTAIAAAARLTGADVRVMAPMVATAGEAGEFAALARDRGLDHVGAMIEVPAAALRAAHLLEHLDFLSVGTNDLGQYALAADREAGELADLLDPWQPALIQLVAAAAGAAVAAGKPIGVCGEAAADPLFAAVLAGLGVTSLSMTPRRLPAVRAELARHTLQHCRELAELALSARDAASARAGVAAATAGAA